MQILKTYMQIFKTDIQINLPIQTNNCYLV